MKRPNFLFICSDQHNADFTGYAGHSVQKTPALDSLAREGIVFRQAYCQNPLCVPSRASMMMGKYSKNIGIYENRHIMQSNNDTLPRLLSREGYHTCMIGKTHINGEQYQGFDQRPYGDIYGQAHQPDPRRTPEKGESGLGDILLDSGPSGIPLAMTQTEICVAEAVKWLQIYNYGKSANPFFCCVNFDKPHFPINPPERYFNSYAGKVTLPEQKCDYIREKAVPFVKKAVEQNGLWEHYGINREFHEKTLAAYCGCIEWVDNAMGRIVDALDYMGLGKDTIVIYTSDHGEMACQKGFWQKSVFFDQSARVPLIIRYPERFSGGRELESPVGLIDMFPTICSLAGIEPSSDCDGEDLTSYLLSGAPLSRKEIFCESAVLKVPEHAGCMLRTEKWKYNYYLDGFEELYDMSVDPLEDANLCNDSTLNELKQTLKEKVIVFWEPDKQLKRYAETPLMRHEKHFYFYSNQFVTGDGKIVDAAP